MTTNTQLQKISAWKTSLISSGLHVGRIEQMKRSRSCVEPLESQSADNESAEPCRYEDQRPCLKLLLGDPPHLPFYHFRGFMLVSKLFVHCGISLDFEKPACWRFKKEQTRNWKPPYVIPLMLLRQLITVPQCRHGGSNAPTCAKNMNVLCDSV